MRAALPLVLALAGVAPQATAASSPAPPPPETIVELRLNGQQPGVTVVARRDANGSLLIKASDLDALRLRRPAQDPELVEGVAYYRLGTGSGASVAYDGATQTADVTLPPDAYLATHSRAAGRAVPRATGHGIGGFVNYDVFTQQAPGLSDTGGIAEAGMFGPFGVGAHSMLARDDGPGASVVRLDTTWTRDFPERLATLRVGDTISAAGAWGRSVRFGGVQFGTNFQTQPTLVTTPLLTATGQAVVPSTVDVFVNGQPVASEAVPPGPFTIDRLPAITGSGELQVVITDALGRQQVVSERYYSGPSLLAAGLSQYSFELGAIREDYGLASNAYGSPVAAATYRRGVTDGFTAEVHAEGEANGPAAAGADAAWQLGTLGIVTLTAAGGGDAAGSGWLGGAGFERRGRRVSLFARSQYATQSFAQLGTDADLPRPRQRTFAGIGVGLGGFGNLQFAFGAQTYWTAPRQQTLGLSHSVSLGARGFLNLMASRTTGDEATTSLLASWTVPFGGQHTANLSVQRDPDALTGDPELRAVASLQRSLPPGPGFGYVMSLATDDDAELGLAYKGRGGQVGVDYVRRDGLDGWQAGGSGGLAITSAGILPTRRLDRSFAVIRVADYPGMTVYLDNHPVGRTDAKGRVLLDSLRPYEVNEVSIDPLELPMNATLTVARIEVVPAYRSGEVVAFPVRRSHPATLKLRRHDGTPVPAGARVRVGDDSLPVALDGLVFVEDVAGQHEGRAEWLGGHCAFEIPQQRPAGMVVDLGNVPCRADEAD